MNKLHQWNKKSDTITSGQIHNMRNVRYTYDPSQILQ